MKFLQDLVPGCNKVGSFCDKFVILDVQGVEFWLTNFGIQVTGKAVMLDEIINYVQSLQRQVEVRFTER